MLCTVARLFGEEGEAERRAARDRQVHRTYARYHHHEGDPLLSDPAWPGSKDVTAQGGRGREMALAGPRDATSNGSRARAKAKLKCR